MTASKACCACFVTLCRYEVRKKKKAAACIDEIAELVVDKFTDKLGANKAAWKVQVR